VHAAREGERLLGRRAGETTAKPDSETRPIESSVRSVPVTSFAIRASSWSATGLPTFSATAAWLSMWNTRTESDPPWRRACAKCLPPSVTR